MSRRLFAFLLPAAFLLAFTTVNSPAPEDVVIAIGNGSVTINGKTITPTWKRKSCEEKLGKADRIDKDANNVYTYDSLGMLLYESGKNPGALVEVQAYFRVREPDALTPKGSGFRGKVLVDNIAITPGLKPAELEEKLEKWKNTGCYIEHCYRYSCKGVYIFFQFDEDENELTDISIGPDPGK